MTANPTPLPPEGVTEEDRKALDEIFSASLHARIKNNDSDEPILQILARHRIAATSAAEGEELRRDLAGSIEDAKLLREYVALYEARATKAEGEVEALRRSYETAVQNRNYYADERKKERERATKAEAANARLLDWAVERWRCEVEHRPLVNIHRRSLDDAWRQVIRKLNGDPDLLVGPAHDDLLQALDQGAEG